MSVQSGNWSREQNFDTPSLNLDFVNGKGVDSRLKTLRTGTTSVCTDAGYVKILNSNTAGVSWYPGTTPYSSTNPAARECLGLQIDPPRTNEFADTTFEFLVNGEGDSSASGATVGFAGLGPDGLANSCLRLTENTNNGTHLINQTWTAQNGETGERTFTASVWVKPGPALPSGRRFRLRAGGNGAIFASIFWNPETNAVSNSVNDGAVIYDSGVEIFTDGWVRLHMTATFNDSSTATGLILQSTDGSTTSYPGDTDAIWFLWGPQFETGGGVQIGTGETEQGFQHTGYIRNYSPDNHNASRSEQRTFMDLIKYRGLINTQWNSPQNRSDNAWVYTGFLELDMRTAQKFDLNVSGANKNYGVFKLCNYNAYNTSQGFCFQVNYTGDQVNGKLIDVNKDYLLKARNLSGSSVPGPTIGVRGLSSGTPQNTQCNVNPGVFSFTASLNNTSSQNMRICSKRIEVVQNPTDTQVQTTTGNDSQVLAFGGLNLAVIQNDGKLPYVGWIKKFTMWPIFIEDDATGDAKLRNLSQGY